MIGTIVTLLAGVVCAFAAARLARHWTGSNVAAWTSVPPSLAVLFLAARFASPFDVVALALGAIGLLHSVTRWPERAPAGAGVLVAAAGALLSPGVGLGAALAVSWTVRGNALARAGVAAALAVAALVALLRGDVVLAWAVGIGLALVARLALVTAIERALARNATRRAAIAFALLLPALALAALLLADRSGARSQTLRDALALAILAIFAALAAGAAIVGLIGVFSTRNDAKPALGGLVVTALLLAVAYGTAPLLLAAFAGAIACGVGVWLVAPEAREGLRFAISQGR